MIEPTKCPGMYRGIVVDNVDPDKQGKIKVQVWPMFLGITNASLLPWAVPAQPVWGGAGTGYGHFAVPAIGSQVFVFFEGQDVYQPVYFAEAQNALSGIPADAKGAHYPNVRVLQTPAGIKIITDDIDKSIKIITPKNSSIEIDKDGNIKLTSVKDVDIVVAGNANVNATGDIVATAIGSIVLTSGDIINIVASSGFVSVDSPGMIVYNTLMVGNGADGSFTSQEGLGVTVVGGIVVDIS